jgi:hypothetical protein
MRSFNVVAVAFCLAVLGLSSVSVADNSTPKATVISSLSSMPLAFTENQGQWPDSVLFRANAAGATMWFTKNGAYYQFTRRIDRGRQTSSSAPLPFDAAHEDIRRAQELLRQLPHHRQPTAGGH